MSSELPPTTSLSRKDYHHTIARLDLLQRLLHSTNSLRAFQAYESNLLFQTPKPPIDFTSGIDLESENLVTHFAKLWLRKEPDQSFFQATHPALVKLRQQEIPRWQQSRRWKSWSEFQAKSKYQQLSHFDPFLLPNDVECRDLFRRFNTSYDWYFELLTESESNFAQAEIHHYQTLGLTPATPQQWTRVALALAVCRLTLASSDWINQGESEDQCRSRYEKILHWCDLSVMALQRAGMDHNPTVEDMRVLIILTSTIYFETDCGLMASAPQMFKLHQVAHDLSERLDLHRDPATHLSTKEKDDRRRMWWALVTIDAHFCSTGATSRGALRLQNSDTKLPAPRKVYGTPAEGVKNVDYSYLRSSRSRFDLGKINNMCCHLLAQRQPLPTLLDIWKFDQDLVALEENVPVEHRLTSDLDFTLLFQRPLQTLEHMDDALRNGQLIFYISLWHIRSKIHRGLLYFKHTCPLRLKTQINIDAHRDIVKRCSYSLVHLYRYTNLPTAFTSAIASAALTLILDLAQQPLQPYYREIRTIVLECFSRFQTISSPIINRACQVLEYFLQNLQPHVGVPNHFPTAEAFKIMGQRLVDASENRSHPFIHVTQETQSEASKEAKKLVIEGSSSMSLDGNQHHYPVPPISISPAYQRGTGAGHRPSEITSIPSTANFEYQAASGFNADLSTLVQQGEIFHSQNTIPNFSIGKGLDFELGGNCDSIPENSQILHSSGSHIGSSDVFTSSNIFTKACVAPLEAMPPSTSHHRDDAIPTSFDSNPMDYRHRCLVSTSNQPSIDFTTPLLPMTPNDLLIFRDLTASDQYQKTLENAGLNELFDFKFEDYSKNLQEQLTIHDKSSFPIEVSNSSNFPSLQITPIGYLSRHEAVPGPAITNQNSWSGNCNEEKFSWKDDSIQPVGILSSGKMISYEGADQFIGVQAQNTKY